MLQKLGRKWPLTRIWKILQGTILAYSEKYCFKLSYTVANYGNCHQDNGYFSNKPSVYHFSIVQIKRPYFTTIFTRINRTKITIYTSIPPTHDCMVACFGKFLVLFSSGHPHSQLCDEVSLSCRFWKKFYHLQSFIIIKLTQEDSWNRRTDLTPKAPKFVWTVGHWVPLVPSTVEQSLVILKTKNWIPVRVYFD